MPNPKEGGRTAFDDGRSLEDGLNPAFDREASMRSNRFAAVMGIDTEPPNVINWNGFKEDDRAAPEHSEAPEEPSEEEREEPEPDWDQRAKDALEFSTNYVDQNYRKHWDDSLRAFNNMHPADSRYNTESFRKRSNLYVPRTRSIIRKNEAAAAAAFFSNMDRVSISGMNLGDVRQRISAELNQALLQYRLTKSIPWFQVVLGGCQDAQTMGACVWNPEWQYETRRGPDGKLKVVKDQPEVRLIALENFRFDPSANWMDPVNTSPYLIELMPMFWVDVKDRMERPDPKGRSWKRVRGAESLLGAGADRPDDSTRASRYQPRLDPNTQQRDIADYEIVWVHRHIHRWNGKDYEWYTLRSEMRLCDPAPLEETEFHGQRPYVMGLWLLETHKALPSSVPTLVKPLADEANELRNSRLDAVKFAINPGFFAKRGRNVDLPALVRNVPGRIVLSDDPEKDVRPMERQDVTQSAYLEEDRNSQAFDELAGNFNPMAMQQARTPRESAATVRMLHTPANMLTEYSLLTFSETGVRRLVEMLVLLEQHYETDQAILAIAGQKAQAYQKYGLDQITDDLLDAELTVAVNVGMGATDPTTKLQRFMQACLGFAQVARLQPPGVNLSEVFKEVMALSGYQDGERFSAGQNPEMAKAQQMIMAMRQKLQQLQMAQKDKSESNIVKWRGKQLDNLTKLRLADKEDRHQDRHKLADHFMEREIMGASAQNTETAARADFVRSQTGAIAEHNRSQPVLGAPGAVGAPALPAPQAAGAPPLEGLTKALEQLVAAVETSQKTVQETDRAVAALAETVRQDIEVRSKPAEAPKARKRRGKAKLPSGGEMVFEMEEE